MEQKTNIEEITKLKLNAISSEDSIDQIANQLLSLASTLESYEFLEYFIDSDSIVSSQKIFVSEDGMFF